MNIPVYNTSDIDVLSQEASGVGVKPLEKNFRERQNIQASHRHNFYLIVWINQGYGTHFIDFNAYLVQPLSLYFISPGQVHSWNLTQETTGYIIAFTNEFFSHSSADYKLLWELPYFYTVNVQPVIYLDERKAPTINTLVQQIEYEYRASLIDRSEMLYAYVQILLIEAKRLNCSTSIPYAASSKVLITKKFRLLIEAHFLEQTSVREYAKLLGITANYLNETVKATTGKTAGELIRDRLLLEAKRLLIHTQMSISEIAHRLNFDDPSYFGKFFKKYTHCSPVDFRQRSVNYTIST
jgi:AraC-like DNA-binding protein